MRAALGAMAASAVVAVTPSSGLFQGPTSQLGGFAARLRVTGTQVADLAFGWSARCQSGRQLTSGTQYNHPLSIVRGAFSGPAGSYTASVRHADYRATGPVKGRFRVLRNSGRFTSPISAMGDWQASAVLYRSGKRIDSCQTGLVQWAAGTIAAGSPSQAVVPAGQVVGGLTYAQWLARAWQWSLRYRRYYRARIPPTLPCVRAGQQGPVWFLGSQDYYFGTLFTVTCTVPAGRYVFFDYPSSDCSTVERPPFHASTDAGLLGCASRIRPSASSLSVDGQVVSPAGVVLHTAAFAFTMPPRDNWLGVPGKTSGHAAVYGQGVMLAPLSAGVHTIVRVIRTPQGGVYPTIFRVTVS